MSGSPLCLYTARVRPEWLDVNDHMNVAYYALVFDKAAEAFMAYLGIDDDYIVCRDASWVALESHTTFGRELRLNDPLRVTARVLDTDAKRIHLFQTLLHASDGYQAATNELMILHLDLGQRRSSSFPDDVNDRLRSIATDHQRLPSKFFLAAIGHVADDLLPGFRCATSRLRVPCCKNNRALH